MEKIFKRFETQTKYMERLSVIVLIFFSIVLAIKNIDQPHLIVSYVWGVTLIGVSICSFIGIIGDRVILRLAGAWCAFLVWTWLAFVTINIYASIFAILIGTFNIFAFISLSNRIKFDWITSTD